MKSKQAWISVDDRLPDMLELVLCKVGTKVNPIRIYNRKKSNFSEEWDWHDNGMNIFVYKHFVTHWQPLPALPTPQNDKETV
jgi:hypothetical protein